MLPGRVITSLWPYPQGDIGSRLGGSWSNVKNAALAELGASLRSGGGLCEGGHADISHGTVSFSMLRDPTSHLPPWVQLSFSLSPAQLVAGQWHLRRRSRLASSLGCLQKVSPPSRRGYVVQDVATSRNLFSTRWLRRSSLQRHSSLSICHFRQVA